ncbi:hypothetical protein T484DRAFT_2187287 [Baffinella frigidus]|nr:hypothetical protein T484DRAFT_2187287 [Cryptophyta sp. CCMP2293]
MDAPASGQIGPPLDREARRGTDRPASVQSGPSRGREARLRIDRRLYHGALRGGAESGFGEKVGVG